MTAKAQSDHTRASVLALLDSARQALMASVRGLTDEQMELPLPDGWSVKDILAHVALWNEMELADMRRAARGHGTGEQSFDRSFTDQWNHLHYLLRKDFSQDQVLTELEEARQAIVDFLDSLDDEQLRTGYIPVGCMHSIRHDRSHAAQIGAWRAREGL